MTEGPPWYDRETPRDVLRRIRWNAFGAWVIFAVLLAFFGGFRDVLGLTCSAAVTMISFLWLEEIVEVLLQPAAHRAANQANARRLTLRSLGRYALLGVALTVTITIARFNAVSLLLGFSIIVAGICGEALYSLYRSFTG
jgi:small-conductance mechanosensitive channel